MGRMLCPSYHSLKIKKEKILRTSFAPTLNAYLNTSATHCSIRAWIEHKFAVFDAELAVSLLSERDRCSS
jgi:hypothetical protein